MRGFNLEKIHHQPLGQVSAKAMLQPFGSAQGDFYLRFHKPAPAAATVQREEIDAARFEKDSWQRLYFETLERACQKEKGDLDVTALVAKKVSKASRKAQLSLFASDHTQEDDP